MEGLLQTVIEILDHYGRISFGMENELVNVTLVNNHILILEVRRCVPLWRLL